MDSFDSTTTNGDHQITAATSSSSSAAADHGWQKVTYPKRQRKLKPSDPKANGTVPSAVDNDVFRPIELQAEDRRRRRIAESQRAAAALDAAAGEIQHPAIRSRRHLSEDDDEDDDHDSDEAAGAGNEKVEEKKVKQKKPKKPKVTVAEAAAKIDASDFAAFLSDISVSYEGQQDIQLMRFADYFGKKFSAVSSSSFPWVKLFRESPVAKIVDIPLSHVPKAVYKTATDWINQCSIEALGSFVMWCLDSILVDFASQQVGSKGSKKVVQQTSLKSQVAFFVVLAMVLRRKPDALISVLPSLRDNSKYQGHDKLPVVAWMIAQASQGDLAVGLYSWAHNLLRVVSGKSSNPQARDLILQLVEKILSAPKARTILVNGAVRKGERLIPPSAFEILLRVTFPASSARVKATERFEAIYPTLKEVALAGAPGSKAMKQVSQQIMNFAIKAAGEDVPELSKEAAGICIWCFTQNAECYKQWDMVYQDSPEASVAILRRLHDGWKELYARIVPYDHLRETLKNFRQKNEKLVASGSKAALFKEADKYTKAILGKVSGGNCCMIGTAVAFVALAAGVVMSPNIMESEEVKKLYALIISQFSS